jgi:formylglycine-generating enzyme required for sulfatase activity
MAGNVLEWTADWYSATYYGQSLSANPLGPTSGDYRVLRGGSWVDNPDDLRVSDRNWYSPGDRVIIIGFRCAR